MRKLLISLLCVSLLCGCGAKETPESNSVTIRQEATQEATTAPASEANELRIDESVIFEDGGITVTAKGWEETFSGIAIKLMVENSTDRNIVLAGNTFQINDVLTLGGSLHIPVAAGKKANGEITFSNTGLRNYSINNLMSIGSGDSWIYDSDTFESISSPDFIIQTSLYGSEDQQVDTSGNVLFESEDYKIIEKYINHDENTVYLLMYNGSEDDIIIQPRNVSVNDFTVNVGFSDFINAGTYRLLLLQIYDNEMEANDIQQIENVEFSLVVLNPKNHETIVNTDVLRVTSD